MKDALFIADVALQTNYMTVGTANSAASCTGPRIVGTREKRNRWERSGAEHYLLAKLPKLWPRSQELHDIGVPERGEVCRVDVTSRERAESVLRRAGWNLRGPCSTRL